MNRNHVTVASWLFFFLGLCYNPVYFFVALPLYFWDCLISIKNVKGK